jgi:hypothetical protein
MTNKVSSTPIAKNPSIARWRGFLLGIAIERVMAVYFDPEKSIKRLLILALNGTTTTRQGIGDQ